MTCAMSDELIRRRAIVDNESAQLSNCAMTDEILKIIADYLDIPLSELTPDRTLAELGVDSVDVFEILFELEEKFGIRFPGDMADLRKEIVTIADVIRRTSELGETPRTLSTEPHG
jgi:acyl carrier protein